MATQFQLAKVVPIGRTTFVFIETEGIDALARCCVGDCEWTRKYAGYRGDAVQQAKLGSRTHLRMKHRIREE